MRTGLALKGRGHAVALIDGVRSRKTAVYILPRRKTAVYILPSMKTAAYFVYFVSGGGRIMCIQWTTYPGLKESAVVACTAAHRAYQGPSSMPAYC